MQLNQYKYITVPVLLKSNVHNDIKHITDELFSYIDSFPGWLGKRSTDQCNRVHFMKVWSMKNYKKLYFTIQRKSVQFIVSLQAPWRTEKWLCSQTHEYISIRYKYMNTQRQNMCYMYDRALYRSSATSSADLACILGPAASIINLSPSARTARKHTALYHHQCIQYIRQYST